MKNLSINIFMAVLLVTGFGLATSALAKDNNHNWKDTLTRDQQQQVAKFKLDYKKVALPIKARIRQARIELAMLSTVDQPDQTQIDSKIEEILKLKGEKIRARVKLRTQIRNVLNEEQRIKFDLHVLKKASLGKKQRHHDNHPMQPR